MGTPPAIQLHVASFNTVLATEVCIRSMRRWADLPFSLVVGDAGSTDGSLEMLRAFEARGWLRLEVASEGRAHAEWLDRWREGCPTRWCGFVDSDVEFRGAGWLSGLVGPLGSGVAAVAGELVPEIHDYRAAEGNRHRLARRLSPWLLAFDTEATAAVAASFAYSCDWRPDLPEGLLSWDVGANFLAGLDAAGLRWEVLPPALSSTWHHYGGLSWQPRLPPRAALRRRLGLAQLHVSRARLRRLQHGSPEHRADAPPA